MIEFHGPFIFKWRMYDTLELSGLLSGSVSISVGPFTKYSRIGTDVIKSSKCHPDALWGSGLKDPQEKKARTSQASSDDGKRRHRDVSKAAQAEERLKRKNRLQCINTSGGPCCYGTWQLLVCSRNRAAAAAGRRRQSRRGRGPSRPPGRSSVAGPPPPRASGVDQGAAGARVVRRPAAGSTPRAGGRAAIESSAGPHQRHRPANPSSGISKNLAQKSTIDIFSHEEQYDWLSPAQAWAIAACCV